MKGETYKFIYKAFIGSKDSLNKVLFLIFISILGALFEIGFLSIINIILQPNYDETIFSNFIFLLIILLSIFFGFFKIYTMRFCGKIVTLLSQNIYRDSFLFSLNKSLFNWSSEESSFITKTTISSYRITNGIIVPVTFAIPPSIVSIFLSIYLIYRYPLMVLIGILCVTFYYLAIIKIVLPILKNKSISYKVKRESIIKNLANEFDKHLNLSLLLN